jgi:general secretion pathway protein K
MNFGAGFPPSRRSSRPAPTRSGPDAERGWALVSVLWIVAILSMLAAAGQALTLTSYKTEHRAQDAARAGSDLDAVVARAAAGITDPLLSERWRVDGEPRDFAFDGLTIRVSVQDQLGCIDLNTADISMLRQLLQSQGLDPAASDALADKILDWRNPSNLRSLHGATDADYAAAGLPYRERHGAFQSVDELKLVLGMTPELFAKLRPALTVYTHRPGFDSNYAPRAALMALYFNDPKAMETVMEARANGSGLQSNNPNSVPPGILSPSISVGGRAFAVDATVMLRGKRFERHAVIEMTADDKQPYFALAWR